MTDEVDPDTHTITDNYSGAHITESGLKHISPSVIGEYLSFGHCPRYFKHRAGEITKTKNHSQGEFTEAFNPLNILLSKAGEEFEQQVLASVSGNSYLHNCESDQDLFSPNDSQLLYHLRELQQSPTDQLIVLYQPSFAGEIGDWAVSGDADFVFLWSVEGSIEVRTIDAKSAEEQKTYHQIQAAIYTDLIRQVIGDSDLDANGMTFSAGVITRGSEYSDFTPQSIPSFDFQSRIVDVRRLLAEDGELITIMNTDFEDVSYQLDNKCNGCAYNEACVTESFEEGHVRLLGLTESEQEVLHQHGVTSIEDLANLCREPEDWKPTNYQEAKAQRQTYRELKSLPGIGERFPTLVYRAQALLNRFTDGVSDDLSEFPAAWLPGAGMCDLPDDTPTEYTEFEYTNGSMIRVYLNVQVDHLRDRIIQMSARVTASASEMDPQRISVVSESAPSDDTESNRVEQQLLEEFVEELYNGITTIAAGIALTHPEQTHPLLHYYTYTDGEFESLIEAIHRHESTLLDSFRESLEGAAGKDRPRVSHLRGEIESHLSFETPAYGLIHAYDEIQPATDEYSKPRNKESWTYTPPYDESLSVHLRRVFRRRMFNIGVEWEPHSDGSADVNPQREDVVEGLNTRMRYGAEIPLGYIWGAIGRIDDQWVAESEFEEDVGLAGYELGSYRYHDVDVKENPIRPADIAALGRHLVDVLEHVERGLYFRDTEMANDKVEVDVASLHEALDDTPTIAEAALDYLRIEHTVAQQESYQHYQKNPPQRILSGDSLPVEIAKIDADAGDDRSITVTGRLEYDTYGLFPNNPEAVKRNCRKKGSEGTSSGSWMVANPFDPGRTDQEISNPKQLEAGISATLKYLNVEENKVVFELTNWYHDPGEFGTYHRWWTTDEGKANYQDHCMLIKVGDHLILDPQTDNIAADRAKKALENAETNHLHQLLESTRWGESNAVSQSVYDETQLAEFADWMSGSVDPDSLPNERQREFITSPSQVTMLQGPPGTGKTAGAMAPGLCGRLYAALQSGEGLSGVVTAASNTAIDEVLDDVVSLLDEVDADSSIPLSAENINLVRVTSDNPDDGHESVEYLDYNSDDEAKRLDELYSTVLSNNTPSDLATDGGQTQATFSEFNQSQSNESSQQTDTTQDESYSNVTHTLFFVTPTKSWGLLKHFAGESPDPDVVANQSYWDLLAIDEASMLTLPNFILAGCGMKPDAQLLVSGDHRQLPPVQQHDWVSETRSTIESTLGYLSGLDYLRVLSGDETVVDSEEFDRFDNEINPTENEMPLIQLNETYRFDQVTADFIQNVVYSSDGIEYTSGKERDPSQCYIEGGNPALEAIFNSPESIVLVTYDADQHYQQMNPIEAVLSQELLLHHNPELSAGLVTPHNAQRSRLRALLYGLQHDDTVDAGGIRLDENTHVETVERFQGGQQDLMIVSATVSDPRYIDSENEFLLEENRANVSFTRHKNKLVVLAPKTLFAHIPTEPDIYDEAELWKSISVVGGEAPLETTTPPAWSGSLSDVLTISDVLSSVDASTVSVEIYPVSSGDISILDG